MLVFVTGGDELKKLVFLLLMVLATGAFADDAIHQIETFNMVIDDSGDTAMVIAITPSAVGTGAYNSYAYLDTFLTNADTDTAAVTWTSPATGTTVAMICDSMVKYINAASCGTYLTAEDSTTYFKVTSDRKGLAFKILSSADTVLTDDTATSVPNKTSWGTTIDTLWLTNDMLDYNGLYARFILRNPLASSGYTALSAGAGAADSGTMVLVSAMSSGQSGMYAKHLDSNAIAVLPCSLKVSRPYVAANDSLLLEQLFLIITVKDTLTYPDGRVIPCDLVEDVILREY